MLATLLIIRQFLQNVKEVIQPYLYERHKLGDLTLRAVWDLLLSALLKYGRLAAGKAQLSPSDQAMPGPGLRGTRPGVGQPDRREKKCLNGGCGVPEEEEEQEDGGRNSEEENEEESLIDCGLKLRKVSFIERVERKPGAAAAAPQAEDSFLEEGSPTMVEKGMDPASVFELCDEDDEDGEVLPEVKEASREAPPAPLPAGPESTVTFRHRRRGRSLEREEAKAKRESWIQPPEEREPTTLTQAEIESCMQTYEVSPWLRLSGGLAFL